MKWREFRAVAHPPECAIAEAGKGALWRGARWLGIRTAFVCYRLRFSANGISLLAWLLGVAGLGCLAWISALPRWVGLIVVGCCWGSVFLDFCDGPLARALRTCGPLGKVLDGIATDFLRAGLPVALGVAAASKTLLLVGFFSGYVIVFVRNQFIWAGLAFDARDGAGPLARLLRLAFSVPAMVGVLPALIALAAAGNVIRPFSRGLALFYLLLALLWFGLACMRADARTKDSRNRAPHVAEV
jgi:phosphatidylglycerophosphate synthase